MVTPKNFIFRTREFEQIEIEYFCRPGTDEQHFADWHDRELAFFTDVLGFKKESVRFVEIPKEGLPHYSKRAGDFEFLFFELLLTGFNKFSVLVYNFFVPLDES